MYSAHMREYTDQKGAVPRWCSAKTKFQKFCKIHRITSVSQSLFNKVAGLQPTASYFIKIRLKQRVFSFELTISLINS